VDADLIENIEATKQVKNAMFPNLGKTQETSRSFVSVLNSVQMSFSNLISFSRGAET